MNAQARTRFQQIVIRINDHAVWFGPPEGFHFEGLRRPGDQNFLRFRISFGINSDFYRHAKCIEILMYLADDFEPLTRAVDDVFKLEFGNPGGIQPLRKKGNQIYGRLAFHRRRNLGHGHFFEVIQIRVFPFVFLVKLAEQ